MALRELFVLKKVVFVSICCTFGAGLPSPFQWLQHPYAAALHRGVCITRVCLVVSSLVVPHSHGVMLTHQHHQHPNSSESGTGWRLCVWCLTPLVASAVMLGPERHPSSCPLQPWGPRCHTQPHLQAAPCCVHPALLNVVCTQHC